MKEQDRIWELIAHKLAGEATEEELEELHELLQKYPDKAYSMQLLLALWKPADEDGKKISPGFDWHLKRMSQRQKDRAFRNRLVKKKVLIFSIFKQKWHA